MVNVNAQGSDVPWDDLPFGNQRQRRPGSGSSARRRSMSSIPPPSPTSNRSSDSDLSEPEEAGSLSGQYSTRAPTEGRQPNLSSHSAPLPSHPTYQVPPPVVPLHPDCFPSPLSNSLGLTDLQTSTPRVYGSSPYPHLSQTMYSPAEPPIAVTTVITSAPHIHPQFVDESPATHFARLQTQQRTTRSTTQGYSHTTITYTPSPSLPVPQQRLQRTPMQARATQAFSTTPIQVQAVPLASQARRHRPLPPTPQPPSTLAVTAPQANLTLPPGPWALTSGTIYGAGDIAETAVGSQLFLGHASPHATGVNTIPYPQAPAPPSRALYQMDPNYNIHGHYNVPPIPVFLTSPYPHPVDNYEWRATVGGAYGPSTSYPSRPPGSGLPGSPPPVYTGSVEG